jgi:hypothetical protein
MRSANGPTIIADRVRNEMSVPPDRRKEGSLPLGGKARSAKGAQ